MAVSLVRMLPLPVDVDIKERHTGTLELAFRDAAGAARDITGETVVVTVGSGGSVVWTATNTVHTDAVQGITQFTIPDTAFDLTAQSGRVVRAYRWQAVLEDASGNEYVWFEGDWNVHGRSVT